MDNPSSSSLAHYRQILLSPERREAITVARKPLVDDTLERLRGSAKRKSKHHFLFIGPRGIGKSHFLSLITDRIQDDPELAQNYHIARFPEESHRTLSFADFLLGLCDILRETTTNEPEWEDLYQKLETEEDDDLIIDTLVPAIRRANRDHRRTTLVMLENLNEMFTRQIKSKKDIGALRKFFNDPNGCLLMATSPIHFDAITRVEKPFYDFFDVQLLEYLSQEEAISLIRRNLEWDKKKELLADFDSLRPKLLALYRMTAGNPRLTVMLYELIAHESITRIHQQFQILLDRITPFYQDRLNDLPPQERALLETLARMRDTAKTPTAISEKLRLPQKQTSILLKRLTDAQYLTAHPNPADKRSKFYIIREGFFDIWLAMNLSRQARKRLPFLLNFFAIFYPDLEERNRKRAELAAQQDDDALASLDYLSCLGTPEEQLQAKLDLARQFVGTAKTQDASELLAEARKLQGQEQYADYLGEIEAMVTCWDSLRDGQLETFSETFLSLSEDLSYKSWSETKIDFLRQQLHQLEDSESRVLVLLRLENLFRDLARFTEREEVLLAAQAEVKINQLRTWESTVLTNLAALLIDANRLKEAEPLIERALQIEEDALVPEHPEVAVGLNLLAQLLQDTNRLKEAEPLMKRALQIDEAAFGPEHFKVAIRLNNLAQLFQDTDRLNEAEPLMKRALQISEAAFGPKHPNVAVVLNNLASIFKITNRLKKAEPFMKRALQIDEAAFGSEHPTVAIKLNNLAQLFQDTERLEEAESLMKRALQIDEDAFGPKHPKVATRLNNLALLLKKTNRLREAEQMLRRSNLILLSFIKATTYEHPESRMFLRNYQLLLQDLSLSPEDQQAKLDTLGEEAGWEPSHWQTWKEEALSEEKHSPSN